MANIRGIELASEIYDLEDTSARNTATAASQTATQAGQTATQASETATQASQKATQASQKADEMYEAFPSNASDSNKLVTQSDALIYYQSDSSSITDFNNAIPKTSKGAIQMFYLGSDITNAPKSSGGGFIVVAEQLSATYISQLATQIGTNNKYTRSKTVSGWSAWQKLVTESDLTTQTAYRYNAYRDSGTSDVSLKLNAGVYLVEYDCHGANTGHGMILLTCTNTSGNISSVVAWTGSGTAPTFTFSSGKLVGAYTTSGYFWLQATKIGDYF